MNKVECHVSNCQHYSDNLCSLDKIKVDGPAAKEKSQTCCLSFDEKTASATNSAVNAKPATEITGINCKADNCTYNSNSKCTADCICVDCGAQNVASKSGTLCASFVER